MGLQTFPMLTGGKGVHVIVPLTPKAEWPEVKDFAQRFAIALAEAEPERFTAELSKAKRKGRIFIDYLRNQRGATAIMPYSARAREGAPVAAPINWDELDDMTSGARLHRARTATCCSSGPRRGSCRAGARRARCCRRSRRPAASGSSSAAGRRSGGGRRG